MPFVGTLLRTSAFTGACNGEQSVLHGIHDIWKTALHPVFIHQSPLSSCFQYLTELSGSRHTDPRTIYRWSDSYICKLQVYLKVSAKLHLENKIAYCEQY